MSLVNSIVRGFGSQIGRTAANSVLHSKQSKTIRVSASLSFWQGIKTILWFIPCFIFAVFVNTIYNAIFNEHFLDKSYTPNFKIILFIAIIFTTIIGYGYYQENKKNLK